MITLKSLQKLHVYNFFLHNLLKGPFMLTKAFMPIMFCIITLNRSPLGLCCIIKSGNMTYTKATFKNIWQVSCPHQRKYLKQNFITT